MKLTFDDDRGYEAFQFMWMALRFARTTEANIASTMTLVVLMKKLAAVSKDHEGGRVLKDECQVEISDHERLYLLDVIAHTDWLPAVFKQVRKTCQFLGAEFESPPPVQAAGRVQPAGLLF